MNVQSVMQSKWTLAGLVAALVALPNLGKGLSALSWLVNSPTVAYAAKGQADDTADQFQQYLAEQRAYTQALNDYTKQMQRQQQAPALEWWQDERGAWWYCAPQQDDCRDNAAWRREP